MDNVEPGLQQRLGLRVVSQGFILFFQHLVVLGYQDKLLQVPHVEDGRVDIVFDPPGSYDSLEEEARLELGLI